MTRPSTDPQGDRIDTRDAAELAIWAKRMDATPAQIEDAVAAVGSLVADVEMHLKGSHSSTNADRTRAAGR